MPYPICHGSLRAACKQRIGYGTPSLHTAAPVCHSRLRRSVVRFPPVATATSQVAHWLRRAASISPVPVRHSRRWRSSETVLKEPGQRAGYGPFRCHGTLQAAYSAVPACHPRRRRSGETVLKEPGLKSRSCFLWLATARCKQHTLPLLFVIRAAGARSNGAAGTGPKEPARTSV